MQPTTTRQRVTLTMIVALVALLLLSLFIQVWAQPAEVWQWVSNYPVLEPLAVPGIIWEVIAIACWQAVGLIGLRVAVLIRHRRFGPSSYGWLWAMMAFLIAFIVLVVAAFIYLKSTGFWSPSLGFELGAVAFMALLAVILLVLFLATGRQREATASTDT